MDVYNHLTLFRELKSTDHEKFFVYTRMSPHSFDRLLNWVRPVLLKKVRRGRRMPVDLELKLALTLSYLAHGDSRVSKHWEFRIGKSTDLLVIVEFGQTVSWDRL
ncbi:putative nuclease HARBI1 [Temnothorax longispinosus]|uniref:Putative nuclease HARBI1 n=1 Tax=Temnothorax longispinosus TaxID=300112 RepID=A0A4V3SB45_9HYME|nr:putative nuclease HARBI1 [Temnothorax longispinosus]